MNKKKQEQMSAVDTLIQERGIETDATKGFDKLSADFIDNEKDKLIELLNESKDNLSQGIRQTMTEILIDDAADDGSKALGAKLFQLKNSVYYTQKRIDTIDSLIATLEGSDLSGSDTTPTE